MALSLAALGGLLIAAAISAVGLLGFLSPLPFGLFLNLLSYWAAASRGAGAILHLGRGLVMIFFLLMPALIGDPADRATRHFIGSALSSRSASLR